MSQSQMIFATKGKTSYQDTAELGHDGIYRSYWRKLTLEEMQQASNDPDLSLMTYDEWNAAMPSFKQAPELITKERFDEMLNILPPHGWVCDVNVESFKISERIHGTVTSIFARVGTNYYHLADDFTMKHSEIIAACSIVKD